ncbi:MAG: RNA polymerase factor sigma-54 [Leptospirales bacterium]
MSKIRLGPKTGTRRGISLKLRKSIEILALNRTELDIQLQKELKENPFLEEKEGAGDEDIRYQDYTPEYLPGSSDISSDSEFSIENFISDKPGLSILLQRQIAVLQIAPRISSLIESILSEIDERGFTARPHDKIAVSGSYSIMELKSALKIIESLEPTGVGAENIWQSLEWQAKNVYPGDLTLLDLIAIIQNNAESIEGLDKKTIDAIAEGLAISVEVMKDKLKKIATLNLYPAANYDDKSIIVLPDLIYTERGKQVEIQVNNKDIPELLVNRELFEQIPEKEWTEEWTKMYENAQNIIKSLDFRNNSLLKVGTAILEKQQEFFKKGPDSIVPMSLEDIASMVELHISTISRIVRKKYCQTKFGIFQLKIFFPRKMKSKEGILLGVADLKKAIIQIIDSENRNFPLSDMKISIILESEGFNIKRRTVAKYRKLLHIPSQIERKANVTTFSNDSTII